MKWFLGVFLVSVFGLLWYIWWDDRNSPYDFIRYIGDWPVRFRSRYVHGQTLYEICQNKYKSYLFVQRLGIPVPRLYFYGFLDGLDVATLPECFVIKTLHGFGSKTVFPFIKGVNQFDPSVGMEKVLEKIGGRLCLVEEFLKTRGGEYSIPHDYKVFCFDGVPELVLLKRYEHSAYRQQYYTTAWKPVDDIREGAEADTLVPSPPELEELLRLARVVGAHFKNNVIRIDFYITDRGVVFGEFTPHPFGGRGYTPHGQRYLNKLMKKHRIRWIK